MLKFLYILFLCCVSYLAFTGNLYADSGEVSVASSEISLMIEEKIRISNMKDFNFGRYDGSGDLKADADICIYNNGNAHYLVTITDNTASTPGNFAVESPIGYVPMLIKWNNKAGKHGGKPVKFGVPSKTQKGANILSETCSIGGLSANMEVKMSAKDLESAPAGAYSSTLTIVVEPD